MGRWFLSLIYCSGLGKIENCYVIFYKKYSYGYRFEFLKSVKYTEWEFNNDFDNWTFVMFLEFDHHL